MDRTHLALLGSTFAIAACGLVYELLAGTVSTYLLGDSVYQFSIIIGLFMAAMGLGSYLSRYVRSAVVETFVMVQLVVGVIGGTSALALFFAFAYLDSYQPVLFLLSVATGTLIGIEIPLVIRMLREFQVLRLSVSNVLTTDYLGALLASVLFPIVLIPRLGLIQTSLVFGLFNVLVAGIALYAFRGRLPRPGPLTLALGVTAVLLAIALGWSERLASSMQARLYSGEILYSERTPHQQLTLTKHQGALSFFINGALQFSSLDEYRYHEPLVHPAMALAPRHENVLVLGGGDGLALREILKYAGVRSVTLVDLDPAVTRLFASRPALRALNAAALEDPRVRIVNQDAAKYLEQTAALFDVMIIDLPDPHDVSLSRLYSRWFYTLALARLTASGVLVTQATSPLYAREAFWCIQATVAASSSPYVPGADLFVAPYHAYVPTFGEWGFVLASPRRLPVEDLRIAVPTRFLRQDTVDSLFLFPPDMSRVETEVNSLQTHRLVGYYTEGWSRWYR